MQIATGGNSADNKTLIVFSDDLDKALASFVIANGAASTGKKVTMFFTFWGLNVIKKREKPAVSKDIFGKMFGWMLPANSKKLKLSKMNMGGAGRWMMRLIMRKKRIDSLESLMAQAVENGIEMIACTMSMDVMGVKKEELMDNVVLGGVATYLERAEDANGISTIRQCANAYNVLDVSNSSNQHLTPAILSHYAQPSEHLTHY